MFELHSIARNGDPIRTVAVLDSYFEMPLSGLFGEDATTARQRFGELYAEHFKGDLWPVKMFSYAIVTPERVIVIDPGVGTGGPANVRLGTEGVFAERLNTAGITPDAVTDVVLTHLHSDHIGGAVSGDEPTYPNAVHYLGARDWDLLTSWLETGFRPQESKYFSRLDTMVRLEKFDAPVVIDHGSIVPFPGHTPGSAIFRLATTNNSMWFVGDAIHHPAFVTEADWQDRHDIAPLEACQRRRALVAEIATCPDILAASHFASPFGQVVSIDGAPQWRPYREIETSPNVQD